MADLMCFGEVVSLEKYIKIQVLSNRGVCTRIQLPDMRYILNKLEIAHKKSATKEDMLHALFAYYQDWGKVAEVLSVGVRVNQYTEAFPFMTNADVKRLEKFGVLKVTGYEEFRAYGKYRYATIYNLAQFRQATEEDIKAWLEQYPKGMRKK